VDIKNCTLYLRTASQTSQPLACLRMWVPDLLDAQHGLVPALYSRRERSVLHDGLGAGRDRRRSWRIDGHRTSCSSRNSRDLSNVLVGLLVRQPYSAALTTAINSLSVSGSGLACILLAFAAFSDTPGKSASVIPHAPSAGMLSSTESALIQSIPSSTLASLRPVSRRAMAE